MQISMTGRVALITGGSKGLGYAMGMKFAECGAEIALVARNKEEVEQAAREISTNTSVKACGYVGDVSKAEDIEAVFNSVIADFGKIDILVNNAGYAQAGEFVSVTDEQWQYDFDLKLMAAVRMSRLVFPGMIERKWGRILNMLNTLAKAPTARSAPTSVTRAAGMALTKVLAGEGAAHNVLVNGLNIGRIFSDQVVRAHKESGSDMSLEEFVAAAGKGLPMGRFGEAYECTSIACLLCSDAGGYISGTSINVDGNLSPVV
ncbi:MAG: NAD(P)-dependent dehydrogenase (short-subunit alcohol dehydrogenase family) [Candidatus Azotimanducaceae bacterium]|jgi:3-oxoacyl-[acyl-carrier protein] reductase